jgi:hypothetical protein
MYKGKKYTDLTTGRVVEIKDHFEDIAILDNNSKIKLNRLLDKNFFDEYIDPNSFFKNDGLLSTFAQKIKQIPDDFINNMNESSSPNTIRNGQVDLNNISGSTSVRPMNDEPAVLLSDPELEKEELMRKYNIQSNPINEAQRQLEKFQQLLGEETTEPVQRVDVNRDESVQSVQKVEVNRDKINEPIQNDVRENNVQQVEVMREVIQPKVEDPIVTMFKNVKRNTDFKISLDIENKIPRFDFIEMMEDSYNTSIIDFLANEFTNNLLENPDIIKNKIKEEIERLVYKNKSKVEKINDVSESPLKDVNPQITDAVTQVKPVRKPRPNTAQGEKGFEKGKKETSK